MSKTKKLRRPTKLEELTQATLRQHSHLHSSAIMAKRDLLAFEQSQTEDKIISLTAALQVARERRSVIGATLVGLDLVLGRR